VLGTSERLCEIINTLPEFVVCIWKFSLYNMKISNYYYTMDNNQIGSIYFYYNVIMTSVIIDIENVDEQNAWNIMSESCVFRKVQD
jgi:hypothetical protein